MYKVWGRGAGGRREGVEGSGVGIGGTVACRRARVGGRSVGGRGRVGCRRALTRRLYTRASSALKWRDDRWCLP